MRILMYADRPATLGGIETHINTLAARLVRRACTVTLAFARITDPRIFADAKEAGARVVEASPRDVATYVTSGAYDLLHAHSFGASRLAARLHRTCGIPIVITLHGPGQGLPVAVGAGMHVIAVSQEIASTLQRACGTRLSVIENGIDLTQFSRTIPETNPPGRRSPRSQQRTRLHAVYLGRVGPSKRPGLVALHEALNSRPDVTLRFIANWSPDGDARPSHAVQDSLEGADLVFSTGRGIREAMALGAAACVLGVYWDGLVTPERVDELRWSNFSGRSTRERPTPRAVALTVRELLGTPARLAQLQAFSRSYAHNNFCLSHTVNRTVAVYERLTASAG